MCHFKKPGHDCHDNENSECNARTKRFHYSYFVLTAIYVVATLVLSD